jgi:hypothetical protein
MLAFCLPKDLALDYTILSGSGKAGWASCPRIPPACNGLPPPPFSGIIRGKECLPDDCSIAVARMVSEE